MSDVTKIVCKSTSKKGFHYFFYSVALALLTSLLLYHDSHEANMKLKCHK